MGAAVSQIRQPICLRAFECAGGRHGKIHLRGRLVLSVDAFHFHRHSAVVLVFHDDDALSANSRGGGIRRAHFHHPANPLLELPGLVEPLPHLRRRRVDVGRDACAPGIGAMAQNKQYDARKRDDADEAAADP